MNDCLRSQLRFQLQKLMYEKIGFQIFVQKIKKLNIYKKNE